MSDLFFDGACVRTLELVRLAGLQGAYAGNWGAKVRFRSGGGHRLELVEHSAVIEIDTLQLPRRDGPAGIAEAALIVVALAAFGVGDPAAGAALRRAGLAAKSPLGGYTPLVRKTMEDRRLGPPNSTLTLEFGERKVTVRLGPDGLPARGEMIESVPGPLGHGWFPPGMFSWLNWLRRK